MQAKYITIIWCNNTPDTLSQYTKTIIMLKRPEINEKEKKYTEWNEAIRIAKRFCTEHIYTVIVM